MTISSSTSAHAESMVYNLGCIIAGRHFVSIAYINRVDGEASGHNSSAQKSIAGMAESNHGWNPD
jgi:hypothetical protein